MVRFGVGMLSLVRGGKTSIISVSVMTQKQFRKGYQSLKQLLPALLEIMPVLHLVSGLTLWTKCPKECDEADVLQICTVSSVSV